MFSLNITERYRRTCFILHRIGSSGGWPKNWSTVTCWAASRIPIIEKTRLEYQKADASQYASAIGLQEKDPNVAAARIAH